MISLLKSLLPSYLILPCRSAARTDPKAREDKALGGFHNHRLRLSEIVFRDAPCPHQVQDRLNYRRSRVENCFRLRRVKSSDLVVKWLVHIAAEVDVEVPSMRFNWNCRGLTKTVAGQEPLTMMASFTIVYIFDM